jgi:outer membrane protein assembly factor BamB
MRRRRSTFAAQILSLALITLAALSGCGGSRGSQASDSAGAVNGRMIDWKLFGRVPQRVHYLPSKLNPPLKQNWAYNDQALIEFPPAIANGRLYIVNKYSNVRALDAETGKVVWDLRRDRRYKGPASDVTAPVFGRSQVFVSFEDGTLLSLNASDAKIEWKRELPTTLQSSPLMIGKTLYIGSDKGIFFALNTDNGKTRWTFHVPHVIKASPSFDRGMVYFGDYGGAMFALRASDGREIWRVNTQDMPPGGAGGFYSSPAIANGRVYAGRDDGTVFALDQKTGKYGWSFQAGNFVYGSPAVADVPGTPGSTVYIGSYDHRLYAIDALSGKPRWSYDVGGSIPGTAVVIGHTVYTSSFATGKTIGIDVLTHKKTFSFGSPGYTPMVSDGRALFLVGYYSLHRFEPAS